MNDQSGRSIGIGYEHDLPCPDRIPTELSVTCEPEQPNAGGADRDRTGDPLLAKQVLSQLSYGPEKHCSCSLKELVGLKRWWAWVDLNYRPHAYQACALTN